MTQYLSPADATRIHAEIMARAQQAGELLDDGKLESALLRAANAAFYESVDLWAQAATLTAGVALAHAFSDGNKRLAAALGVIFLDLNGVRLVAEPIALADAVLALVKRDGPLDAAVDRFADWLRAQSTEKQ